MKGNDTLKEKDMDYSIDIWALGICVIEMAEGNYSNQLNKEDLSSSKIPLSITHSSNPLNFSEEFKDFVNQCMQVDLSKRPRASKLFDHPFISKYKGEIAHIRRKFYKEKLEKVAEFKKQLIFQTRNQMNQIHRIQPENLVSEENIADESDMPNNTVEEIALRLNNNDTIDYTLDSDNYNTFIEKPSFNLTEGPSHIEMTNRSPIYMNTCPQTREPLSYIKSLNLDDSEEQSFDITPRIDQLSINLQSSRINSPDEKRDLRIPPLKIMPSTTIYPGNMPTIESQYSCENTYKKSKTNKDDLNKSIMSTQNLITKQGFAKAKMYKATNESNFVVKHRISATNINTNLNHSIDTDTTLNPLSLNRQNLEKFGENYSGVNTTRQMIEGLENFTSNIPRLSSKELTASTAADSKIGSSSFKSIFHTPNPSDCPKDLILKVVKENLECGARLYIIESPNIDEEKDLKKLNVQGEKLRLEAQMKKELEQIKKKYNSMFRDLEKVSTNSNSK